MTFIANILSIAVHLATMQETTAHLDYFSYEAVTTGSRKPKMVVKASIQGTNLDLDVRIVNNNNTPVHLPPIKLHNFYFEFQQRIGGKWSTYVMPTKMTSRPMSKVYSFEERSELTPASYLGALIRFSYPVKIKENYLDPGYSIGAL